MKKGFTLIELMIVVSIIGILGAVAVPAFLRFIQKTKISEAPISFKAITQGALAWYNENHTDLNGNPLDSHFPVTSSPTQAAPSGGSWDSITTPSIYLCGPESQGALFLKNTLNWNQQPWISLKFSITKAHYFQYLYFSRQTGKNAEIDLYARADLNCNGISSQFNMNIGISNTSQDVVVSEMIIQRELE